MNSARIFLVLVTALFITATASAQRPERYSLTVPVHLYNPCCEEFIHFDLQVEGFIRSATDKGGNGHLVWMENVKGTGIGLSSGLEYRFHAAMPEAHRWAADGSGANNMFIVRQHVKSADGSCSFFVKFTLRSVINANGEVVVEVAEMEVDCANGAVVE